jgi:hypothetical protein
VRTHRDALRLLAGTLNTLTRDGYRVQVRQQGGRWEFRLVKISAVTTEDQVLGTVAWDQESREWRVTE